MKYNDKEYIDFPDEVFDYDDFVITYKTSAGEFRYKDNIRECRKKNINPTVHDNTIPISGYKICGFNNIGGSRNGQGRAIVSIKHPVTGHLFNMTVINFYKDVINKVEMKNGVIQSKCFLGFGRYETLFPTRLIIENDPLILGASIEPTVKKAPNKNKLVIGAKCKSKTYGEVIYVGPISKGVLVESSSNTHDYSFGKDNIYKKTNTRLYVFQKCNDPDTLCIETWVGKGVIEKIIDPNAGTNLDIKTIKQSILGDNNCVFDHIEPVSDNSKAEKHSITYEGVSYDSHKLFMYQESPKKIIIVQRLKTIYYGSHNKIKYLLRGEVICNAVGNEVRLEPYKGKLNNPSNSFYNTYYISLTIGRDDRIDDIFDEFTGDIQKLIPIKCRFNLSYRDGDKLDMKNLQPCIRILNNQNKEIPHFDSNRNKIELKANIL